MRKGSSVLAQKNGRGIVGNMDISVILCTFNRCRLLPAALESVAASKMPSGIGWEVLVVDNNSTDQTREVGGGFFALSFWTVPLSF